MREIITVKKPQDLMPLLSKWARKPQENFLAVTLNGHHDVIRVHHITKGLVNRVPVHPRESFLPVLRDNAFAVIFVHNHPSGECTSSPEDTEIANRLSLAGEILGINVVDHLIVVKGGGYYSHREAGSYKRYSVDFESMTITGGSMYEV